MSDDGATGNTVDFSEEIFHHLRGYAHGESGGQTDESCGHHE